MNNIMFYFLMFIAYSFFGWCFECVHMAITTKEIVNRGFLIGPVIPVYGVGLTLVVTFLSRFKNNFIVLFILSFLLIATLEYIVSYLLEKLFHIRWWDYSDKKINLNGRVCLNTMIIFMIGALIIVYFVNPTLVSFINGIDYKLKLIISSILLFLIILDSIISLIVLKKYLKETKNSKRKDRTPEIRKYLRKMKNTN